MRTSQNIKPRIGVTNTLPSLTVPDQSLTLRELLTNYTRGQDLPLSNKTPAFFDDSTFIPDIKKMDLVDIQELMEDNAKKAGELKHKLSEKPQPTILTPQKVEEVEAAPKAQV